MGRTCAAEAGGDACDHSTMEAQAASREPRSWREQTGLHLAEDGLPEAVARGSQHRARTTPEPGQGPGWW
jgi:hypothetical protein